MAIHVLKLLNNQFVRYLVCLVAGTNLFLFLYANKYLCAGVFLSSAVIASYYSKYMVVILVVAMAVCNIVCVNETMNISEGFGKKIPGKGKITKAVSKTTISPSGIKTKVTTAANGAKTKTTTTPDGSKTQTTSDPDGSKTKTTSDPDGSEIEIVQSADGSKTKTTTETDGSTTTTIEKPPPAQGTTSGGNNTIAQILAKVVAKVSFIESQLR